MQYQLMSFVLEKKVSSCIIVLFFMAPLKYFTNSFSENFYGTKTLSVF